VASMTVTWMPPSSPEGLVDYCLRYSSAATPLFHNCTNYTRAVLSDLRPFTFYNVTVAARTTCAESAAVSVRNVTLATLPGPPQRLKVIATLPYSIHIKWEEPILPNGIISHYNVRRPEGQPMLSVLFCVTQSCVFYYESLFVSRYIAEV